MIERIDKAFARLAQGLALIGAIGVLLMLVHVSIDVALRNLGGPPVPATNAIVSRYYMVLIAFLPLGWVESRGSMIKVELTDILLSPRLRALNDWVVSVVCTVIYGIIAWMTLETALKNFSVGSFVDVLGRQVPVWPSFFLPTAGFALAGLICLWRVIRAPIKGAMA